MPILAEIQGLLPIKRVVFAVSDNGLLLAQTGSAVTLSQPIWFDRKGNEAGVVNKPASYGNVCLSRDGRSVAVSKSDAESLNPSIWTYDLLRNTSRRLTFDTAFVAAPIWNPNGTKLIFFSNRTHGNDLFMKDSDGAQQEKLVLRDEFDKFSNDWSRDGKYILYTRGTDLWFATLPEMKTSLFLKAPSLVRNGQFSPDGKWVAYASNETGKWEIYVTSFPEAQGKWQISTAGGEQPRWRSDGKELFFLSSDSKMMAVPVTTGAKFDAGAPFALFQTTPRQQISSRDQFVYDVSRDGQRFLILTQIKNAETQPMSVVLNWPAKLSK